MGLVVTDVVEINFDNEYITLNVEFVLRWKVYEYRYKFKYKYKYKYEYICKFKYTLVLVKLHAQPNSPRLMLNERLQMFSGHCPLLNRQNACKQYKYK